MHFFFFPQFFFHSRVLLLNLGKANANPDHPDYVPSIFNFTKADTAKNIQKVKRFSNLHKRNIEKSKHLEVSKKAILCCSAENKIKVEPAFLPPTSQKPPENFDLNVYCSLTDDILKTPTKPQQKLIESRKENQMKEVSMVASTPYNISLANAGNKSMLHSMNCMEIDFLRKERIDLQFHI